ncbi:hypothetical protein [Sorangium sp. So ce887]
MRGGHDAEAGATRELAPLVREAPRRGVHAGAPGARRGPEVAP